MRPAQLHQSGLRVYAAACRRRGAHLDVQQHILCRATCSVALQSSHLELFWHCAAALILRDWWRRGDLGTDPAGPGSSDQDFGWTSPDESTREPFSREPKAALELAQQYDLCIAGDALRHIAAIGAERTFIPLTQVWPNVAHSGSCLQSGPALDSYSKPGPA